jgi:His/Glu/Gln/Arg/opine family amino acid ABC transporter permease subunit
VLGLLLALAFAWFRGTDLLLFARNFLNLRRIGDNIGLSASAIADDMGSILTLAAVWGGAVALSAYAWVRLRHGNPRVVLWAGLIAGGLGAMWAVLSTAAVRSFALAAQNTLFLSAAGAGLGFGLGLVLALFALSKRSVVRAPARVYINFFRGTPLIWQISFFGIGIVPALRLPISMYTVAILVLGLNLAAYSAEVYRSGVQSLERGQMEASRSLGLSYGQSMRFVVVPQAVRRVIPPLLNEFVILIKDTALVSVLGLTLAQRELLGMGRSLYSQSFDATAWLGAAAGYLIITLPLIRVVTVVEKRMRSGLSSVTG